MTVSETRPPPDDVDVRTSVPRSPSSIIRNTLLNLAAAAGTVCILAVLAAWLFDISLIMFKTGSMSPTIPAGSLAVVREIPATQVHPGDVVTVERPGKLPVTHRVVSAVTLADGSVELELKGDANETVDPATYVVSQVRTVMFSVPGLAKAVVAVSNKWAMLAVTVAVSALVTWVFWPRPEPGRPGRNQGRHRTDR